MAIHRREPPMRYRTRDRFTFKFHVFFNNSIFPDMYLNFNEVFDSFACLDLYFSPWSNVCIEFQCVTCNLSPFSASPWKSSATYIKWCCVLWPAWPCGMHRLSKHMAVRPISHKRKASYTTWETRRHHQRIERCAQWVVPKVCGSHSEGECDKHGEWHWGDVALKVVRSEALSPFVLFARTLWKASLQRAHGDCHCAASSRKGATYIPFISSFLFLTKDVSVIF